MKQKPVRSISTLGLRSLRTFEAAARHLSFTVAAQELFVTTAAISHQVKEIETQLGFTLFTRHGRSVRLTPEGEVMLLATREAIAALEHGIQKLQSQRNPDRVRISAAPSFASKWLVPRLEGFLKQFPSADIRLDVSYVEADLEREDTDLLIRHAQTGTPQDADHAEQLFTETFFPVCSPRLLHEGVSLRTPRDLLRHKLIHVDWATPAKSWPSWKSWLQGMGVKHAELPSGLHFQQTALAIEAAIAGHGIALGEASLVGDDLRQGRLIKPLPACAPLASDYSYYLVARQGALAVPIIRAFRDWLVAEVRSTAGSDASA